MDKKGGDDALHALYAPSAFGTPAGGSQKRFVRGAFGAAFRTQRGAPRQSMLLLGVLPALWALPADLLTKDRPTDIPPFDWAAQGRELGITLVDTAWDALSTGGMILVALKLANGGAASLRDFVTGVRFAPALYLVSALGVLWGSLMGFAMGFTESGEPGTLLALAALLVLVIATCAVLLPWALVSYPLVERRGGLVDALTRCLQLLRQWWWGYTRLFFITMVWMAPQLVALFLDRVYLSALVSSVLGPTVGLAWAHAYLRSSAASAPAAAGPSVAAQPRP